MDPLEFLLDVSIGSTSLDLFHWIHLVDPMSPMDPLDPVEQMIHWNQWIQWIHATPVDPLEVEVPIDGSIGSISVDPVTSNGFYWIHRWIHKWT